MRLGLVFFVASTALIGACRSPQRPAAPVGEPKAPEGGGAANLERPATRPDETGCLDAGAQAMANPPRPPLPELSFLFITVDTLRPDLGYASYGRPVSPNIDELAKQATIYERAYSISTYTAFAVPPMMASRY